MQKPKPEDGKVRNRCHRTWLNLSLHDALFAQIETILRPRGVMPNDLRISLYRLARQHARPGFPACDVLLEIKSCLQRGELLSTILPGK